MKKAFVAILSLAALVACSQDVTVKRNDSAAIGFDNSFVENKTRAAADPSKTTATLEEFAVWGFRDTADQLVLNNERVYKNGTEWTYDHLQYWMEGKDYFFGAVSPVNHKDVTVNTETMDKGGLGIISFTNTDGSVDLLYAEKTVYASEIKPSDPDKVQLQFAHLLSRVKFSFAYNFPNELTTIAVKNIEITNSPAEGSIDVTVDRPYWSWNIPQNGSTLKVAFGDVEGGKEFAELNTYYESDDYRLLIPTDDTRGHNITFDVVVYQNHVESYTYHLATTLKDKAFVQGKSYNIVTTITPDELDMKPIEFTVVEVEGWEDGDVAAPIVLASPAVEATVAQNVVTLKWNAIEGADHYTVQVDDDIAEVVKDTTYVFEGDYAVEYTFNVVAVPADGLNILASEPTVVKATTDAKPVPGHKLYLKNVDGWDKVFVYAWDAENTPILGVWPGVEMTEKETIDEVEYFVYTLSSVLNGETINVIFNDGNGKQTADITGVELTKDNTFTNYVEPVKPTETKLYLQPNANWNIDNARFAAYLWGNGVSAVWYDMTLVEGETNIYEFTLPEGYENIIFCRMNPNAAANDWNNKWNQTADLKVPTDGTNLYIVKEDTWDNGGGTWGTYEPVVAAPVALATPDVTYEVEGGNVILTWDAVDGAKEYFVNLPEEGENYTTTETTFTYEGGYECTYVIEVTAIAADTEKNTNSEAAVVTATTEAAPVVGPTYTTVAEFLAAAEDESATAQMYTLKGTITAVANTSYGNFDLTDDTGTVYIYGLMSPDGTTNKYWATSGAKLGDDIVVKTVRTSFNGTAQGKNAWFVELVSPGTRAFYTIDPAAVDFASAGGEQDIEVFAYNTTAGVTATSDNAAFAVDVNGYVVTVTAAANELEEAVTGNITIKVGDLEPTVVKATLAAKPASGVVEGGSDDFHTISNTNTSYVTGKTTAGWNYKNCAIFKGGTSDSSPAFKMIGDASNRALCMNGKTSAVGTITSPTLTTGCGTLKFNYGLPFSDSKIKFRVDIIQDGAVVKTFTVENSSAAKYTLYSHEETINVAGDFQIVFTNLSPSNSTSNKDRTAIWDVEWTGYNN